MDRTDLFIPRSVAQDGLITSVEPGSGGFEHISLEVRAFPAGASFQGKTGSRELGLVALGGTCQVRTAAGDWQIGERATVFDGLPYTLYLPIDTDFIVQAVTPC